MSYLARTSRTLLLIGATFLAGPGQAVAQAPQAKAAPAVTLKVGDPAPAFKHGPWLKGAPVEALAKGRIYVLEFWATWCGPCIAAIPHVTELAKKHEGKVTFIGVNVLENGKNPADIDRKVAAFVKEKGAAMGYLVCRDSADKAMEKGWLEAAGVQGIPATFIVDGSGRIVWKGHPLAMDPILDQVLAGKFDPAAAEKEAKEGKEQQEAIGKALQAKEWTKALEMTDAYKPTAKVDLLWKDFFKFMAFLHVDDKAAVALYDQAIAKGEEGSDFFATIVMREEGISPAWYPRVMPQLEAMVKKEKGYLGLLAKAQFKCGDAASAVKSKVAEIADLKARTGKILEEHPDAGPMLEGHLKKLEGELKEYQAAVKP